MFFFCCCDLKSNQYLTILLLIFWLNCKLFESVDLDNLATFWPIFTHFSFQNSVWDCARLHDCIGSGVTETPRVAKLQNKFISSLIHFSQKSIKFFSWPQSKVRWLHQDKNGKSSGYIIAFTILLNRQIFSGSFYCQPRFKLTRSAELSDLFLQLF